MEHQNDWDLPILAPHLQANEAPMNLCYVPPQEGTETNAIGPLKFRILTFWILPFGVFHSLSPCSRSSSGRISKAQSITPLPGDLTKIHELLENQLQTIVNTFQVYEFSSFVDVRNSVPNIDLAQERALSSPF